MTNSSPAHAQTPLGEEFIFFVQGSNALGREKDATGYADPKMIPRGEERVKLFFLAGEDRVWHPASMKIEGDRVIVISPGVKKPRGVSYATGEVGFQPSFASVDDWGACEEVVVRGG